MNKALGWLGVSAAAALTAIGAAAPAQAAGEIPVVSECNKGWYVNADEAALLPKQVPAGFVFDGPSLVHHATDAVAIGDVPEVGFTAKNVTGSLPLFKMETAKPYSTINVVDGGKAWSSKIDAAAEGGQNKPVTLDALAALAPYTAETRVVTFGVGYAKDAGNKATVTAITYGTTYKLACAPPTSPSATPSGTPSASPTATSSPTASASPSHTTSPATTATSAAPPAAGPSLPVTGSPIRTLLWIGGGLLLFGGALFVGLRYWRYFHPYAR